MVMVPGRYGMGKSPCFFSLAQVVYRILGVARILDWEGGDPGQVFWSQEWFGSARVACPCTPFFREGKPTTRLTTTTTTSCMGTASSLPRRNALSLWSGLPYEVGRVAVRLCYMKGRRGGGGVVEDGGQCSAAVVFCLFFRWASSVRPRLPVPPFAGLARGSSSCPVAPVPFSLLLPVLSATVRHSICMLLRISPPRPSGCVARAFFVFFGCCGAPVRCVCRVVAGSRCMCWLVTCHITPTCRWLVDWFWDAIHRSVVGMREKREEDAVNRASSSSDR